MRRILAVIALAFWLLALPTQASGAKRLLFGVHTPGDPLAGNTNGIDSLEQALHRRIGIVSWFQNWDDLYSSQVQPEVFNAVIKSGRIPMVTWEPWLAKGGVSQSQYKLGDIAGGRYDDYIARFARGLKSLGAPIYLRPMHEMNGDWYPWGGMVNGNTPELYQQAWRRMHDVFVKEGATNVKWVWSPLQEDVPQTAGNRFERYYPGPAYVDVFALDGYNFGSNFPHFRGWRSFRKIFANAYRRLTFLGPQPVWIAEVGSAAEGGDKAAWVRDMFRTALQMRRLQAIVWMDIASKEEGDWRARLPRGVAPAFRDQSSRAAAASRLRVVRPARVGGNAIIRWTATNTGGAIARWRVYLNGKRVRTLASQARILHKRIDRAGEYRWTVRGYDAQGAQLVSASMAFRVAG
jgi:hypothetical protein